MPCLTILRDSSYLHLFLLVQSCNQYYTTLLPCLLSLVYPPISSIVPVNGNRFLSFVGKSFSKLEYVRLWFGNSLNPKIIFESKTAEMTDENDSSMTENNMICPTYQAYHLLDSIELWMLKLYYSYQELE